MNEEERCTINLKNWQDEQFVFNEMLSDFSELKLRRINLLGDRNNHLSEDINNTSSYLFCSDGVWHISTASKQWWGWSFHGDWRTIQLRNIDILFEITNLPVVESNPLGRIYPEVEEE